MDLHTAHGLSTGASAHALDSGPSATLYDAVGLSVEDINPALTAIDGGRVSDGHQPNLPFQSAEQLGRYGRETTSDDEAVESGVDGSGSAHAGANESASRRSKEPMWKTDNRTCDNCRKRKVNPFRWADWSICSDQIKCVDESGQANHRDKTCDGCGKLGIECTYEYVKKKPGRKNG